METALKVDKFEELGSVKVFAIIIDDATFLIFAGVLFDLREVLI